MITVRNKTVLMGMTHSSNCYDIHVCIKDLQIHCELFFFNITDTNTQSDSASAINNHDLRTACSGFNYCLAMLSPTACQ